MWVSRLDNSVSQDISSTSLVTNRLFFCQLGIQGSFGLSSMSFGIGKSYVDTSIHKSVMNVKCSKGSRTFQNPTWRQLLTEAAAFKRPVREKGVVMNRELVECLFSCLWCSDWVRSTYRTCICSKHFGYFLEVWDHCSWCLSWTWIFQGASFSIWQRHWSAWRK